MAPAPIICIDDGDDVALLPRRRRTSSNAAAGNNQHVQYTTGNDGNKKHVFTRIIKGNDRASIAPSAIDTSSSLAGFVRPAQNDKPAVSAKGKGRQANKDELKQVLVAALQNPGASRVDDSSFANVDMGKSAARNKLMAKVKNVQQAGKHTAMGYDWDLRRVDGDKAHSLLGSAIDDSNSVVGQVASAPTAAAEASHNQAQGGKRDNAAAGPSAAGPSAGNVPPGAAAKHLPNKELLRKAVHNNMLGQHGGVPVPVVQRPPVVQIAHKVTSDEGRVDPAHGILFQKKVVDNLKMRKPPTGIFIAGRNNIRLVHSRDPHNPRVFQGFAGPPPHFVGHAAQAGPTGGGAITNTIQPATTTSTPTAAQATAPTQVQPSAQTQAQVPGQPQVTSNYQAPTVESVSDQGDFGGLFDETN